MADRKAIDFTLTPELEDIRLRVRAFLADVVIPGEDEIVATRGVTGDLPL